MPGFCVYAGPVGLLLLAALICIYVPGRGER